jgi:multiple sugar transport system permease protein
MRSRTGLGRWVLWAALVLGALVMLFPFVWTVVTSISTGAGLDATPSLVPHNASFGAYLELFRRTSFGRVVLNSAIIAVGTVALQILTSALAAYVFSRLPFRGRGVVFGVYLATMPTQSRTAQ